jgi:hypothetical protein
MYQLEGLRHFGKMTSWKDTKSMKTCDWKNVVKNRDRWKKVAEQARTLYSLQRLIRRRRYEHVVKSKL